jgi:UTP--glucose-1-phosphate uridylyltransferase
VLLGDTILEAADTDSPGRPATRQLLDVFEAHGRSVVALEEVPVEKVSRYGIVAGEPVDSPAGTRGAAFEGPRSYRLTDLVEKPSPADAPSRLAISSRYVFTSAIFDALDSAQPGKGGEIQLTDAMRALQRSEGMFGLQFAGRRYDMGNRLDFLKAVIEFALRREDIGRDLAEWLKGIADGL